jgi:hypothetical protein
MVVARFRTGLTPVILGSPTWARTRDLRINSPLGDSARLKNTLIGMSRNGKKPTERAQVARAKPDHSLPRRVDVEVQQGGWRRWLSEHRMAAVIGAGGVLIAAIVTVLLTDYLQDQREKTAAKMALANAVSAASYEVGSFLESVLERPELSDKLYEAHESRMKQLMPAVMANDVALAARDFRTHKRFEPLLLELGSARTCITRIYKAFPQGPARHAALVGVFRGHALSSTAIAARVQQVFDGRMVGWFGFDCHPPPDAPGRSRS